MKYKDLNELLQKSTSSRRYVRSLPAQKQMILREEFDASIHSAADLHTAANMIDTRQRQNSISTALDEDTANF